MKTSAHLLIIFLCAAPAVASAQVSELSQAALRSAVANDSVIGTRALILGVEKYTGGDVVDVRAFNVDGKITYRVLITYEDGRLGSLLVDAMRGTEVASTSSVGRQVLAVAESSSSQGANFSGGATSNSGGNGNSNSGGNSNNGSNGNSGGGNSGNGNGNK